MKKIIAMLLCILFLAGCTSGVDDPTAPSEPEYIGNSPVPNMRTGIITQGATALCNGVEVTENGIYFFAQAEMGQYLLYADHDAEEAVKLCSRPDCTHDTNSCTAFFPSPTNICAHEGHLYIETGFGASVEVTRLDMDGNNRLVVFDSGMTPGGYKGSSGIYITNGVLIFTLFKLAEDGTEIEDRYYWKLDGSMEEPKQMPQVTMYWNHGDDFLTLGEDGESLYLWDPDTNGTTFLTDLPNANRGYLGTEAFYYAEGGTVLRFSYADQKITSLLDTGLEGYYALHGFPDCFVLSESIPLEEQDYRELTTQTLHFYNWDYEYLGKAELDHPVYSPIDYMNTICAETDNRIYLASHYYGMPEYYIEKSDIGKRKIKIRPLTLPQDIMDFYHELYLDPWEE